GRGGDWSPRGVVVVGASALWARARARLACGGSQEAVAPRRGERVAEGRVRGLPSVRPPTRRHRPRWALTAPPAPRERGTDTSDNPAGRRASARPSGHRAQPPGAEPAYR